MVDPPPMARVFWAGPHSIISENLKDEVSTKDWHSSGEDKDKASLQTGIEILKVYAHFHASFWKLQHIVGLKTFEELISLTIGAFTEEQHEGHTLFGPDFSAVAK